MKSKTEQTGQMENEQSAPLAPLAPAESASDWNNAKDIQEQRASARRALRSTLSVVVKHNTPIEQVCMSARLLSLVDDVFSATRASAIMARLGNCEAVRIENKDNLTVANGIFALYKSAKKAHSEGTLTLSEVCELTEKGVKMDKWAFSFYVAKN